MRSANAEGAYQGMSRNTDNKSETLEKRTSDTGLIRVEPQPQTGAVDTGARKWQLIARSLAGVPVGCESG